MEDYSANNAIQFIGTFNTSNTKVTVNPMIINLHKDDINHFTATSDTMIQSSYQGHPFKLKISPSRFHGTVQLSKQVIITDELKEKTRLAS